MHMEKVLMRLGMYAAPHHEGMTDCDLMSCKEKVVRVARLYMKVRIFHAIKILGLCLGWKGQ